MGVLIISSIMKIATIICLALLICFANGASIEKMDQSINGVEGGKLWNVAISKEDGDVGCIQPHFSCSYNKQEECCSGRCYRKEYAFFCA